MSSNFIFWKRFHPINLINSLGIRHYWLGGKFTQLHIGKKRFEFSPCLMRKFSFKYLIVEPTGFIKLNI